MNEGTNNKVIEFLKNPRGRASLFFGFYLIFFIFVFSLLGGNGNKENKPVTLIDKLINSMSNIEKNNYDFKYTITIDEHEYIYEGKRYNEKKEFTQYTDELATKYQSIDNNYFKEINDSYIKVDSPFYPEELFDIKEIKRIIKNSKLYSKTEYQTDEFDYTYQIKLKDLVDLLKEEEISNSDNIISITIRMKSDSIESINIDATSYYNYLKENNATYKIVLEHSNYGKITDFDLAPVVE